MKKLKVDAVVLDLRHLTEETLAAYDKCEMEAVFALMNPHAQALLNQYGVKLDVVQSINGEDDVDVSTINGKATLDGTSIPDKKRAMVVNGKLYMKPDGVKALNSIAASSSTASFTARSRLCRRSRQNAPSTARSASIRMMR